MRCETIPAKIFNIGGHCERPECKLWYLLYVGWLCCACGTHMVVGAGETCSHCQHPYCLLCMSAI